MLFQRPNTDLPELKFWREPVADDRISGDDMPQYPGAVEFELLAENLPTLCWIARGDGYIFWYNRRWHSYCGSTPEQMEGWGWQSVHDPEMLPTVMEKWSAAIATGEPFEMTFPLRGADGHFRRFLTRIVPLRNDVGDITRWFGTNTEVESQVQTEAALLDSEAKFGVLTDAMPQMVWSTLPDGYHDYYNARWYEFTGVPDGSTDGEGWNDMFHPDDQARAWARWQHSLDTGEPYEIEYRLRRHDGMYRWTLGRALPVKDMSGNIIRWIGTCTDIDDAKRDAEQTELMSRELSHRIKNIFAVIGGLIGLSAMRDPANTSFAKILSGRISALGRAHDFARPHSEQSKPAGAFTGLHGLIGEIMKPYRAGEGEGVMIAGDDVPIDDRSATPIALVLHELATNAAKYGALSTAGGVINIGIEHSDELVRIIWRETGGPPVTETPQHSGFGTQLSQVSIQDQLGGSIHRDWNKEGLVVTLEINATRLCGSIS
jgi:PAS domain S-box-containing protein